MNHWVNFAQTFCKELFGKENKTNKGPAYLKGKILKDNSENKL